MKNFTTIRLRRWIPLLVFGAFSLLLLFFTLQEHHQYELNVERSALTLLREQLARTGPRFESFLRIGMSSFVEAGIADLSIQDEVRSIVFVDDQGVVLYGSQMRWLGRPAHEVLPLFDRNCFLSVQKNRRLDIHLSSNRQNIIAYQPVVLAVEPGQIRPTRVGMIFADYDLTPIKARLFHTLVIKSISVWAVGIFLMLTLWAALNRWLTRPLFHLKETVNRFRNGDYLVRADITGKGELTELSQAFNAMADEVRRNITERQKSEEATRENEEFLNSVVENIPNMIFVKDARELKFVRFNKAGEELLGYQRQDLYGKNDYDLFPHEQAELFTKKDRVVLNSKKLADIPEETIDTRHQGKRIMHTKKIPIVDAQGAPKYLLGISEDITERIQGEEERHRLIIAIEQSVDSIVITDKKGMIQYVNPSFEKITGYSKEEAIGKNPRILQSDRYDTLFYREIWRTLVSGKAWQGHLINKKKAPRCFRWVMVDGTV